MDCASFSTCSVGSTPAPSSSSLPGVQCMGFRQSLSQWQDFDIASYEFALSIVLIARLAIQSGTFAPFPSVNTIFWANKPLGTLLTARIRRVVEAQTLQCNDEPQLRWNP